MKTRNAWRQLTVWCAIGVAAVGLIDPASCTALPWKITRPPETTPPTTIANVGDLVMEGDGLNNAACTYRARLHNAIGVMEGDGPASFMSAPMDERWAGAASQKAPYTSGDANVSIWEVTAAGNEAPKRTISVTVS